MRAFFINTTPRVTFGRLSDQEAGASRTLAGRAMPAALKTGPIEPVTGHILRTLADGDLLQSIEITAETGPFDALADTAELLVDRLV